MSALVRRSSVAFALLLAAAGCGPAPEEAAPVKPDLAADTANLPQTHILRGEFPDIPHGDEITVENIEKLLAEPRYQNQPAFLGPAQNRFYFVDENDAGKTDIWVYDLDSGEKFRITNTPEKSEFSPKPAPDERMSFIQESEDGEITRVHALAEIGDTGEPVTVLAPVGYYEWLQGGKTLAVFYRSDPPALMLVDIATGNSRKIFDHVGRSFQASFDGATLYATQEDKNGHHQLFAVDAVTGDVAALATLPGETQDFRIAFDPAGAPAAIFSSDGPLLMTHRLQTDEGWRVAADISAMGYASISRIAIGYSVVEVDGIKTPLYGPIVFVAQPNED